MSAEEGCSRPPGANLAALIDDQMARLGCEEIELDGVCAGGIAIFRHGGEQVRCSARTALTLLFAIRRRCRAETVWTGLVGVGKRITTSQLEDTLLEAVGRLAEEVGARQVSNTLGGLAAPPRRPGGV